MLLSRFASVGDMPYPLLPFAAEFSAVAQTTALVERHSGARDGRTRLPLSLQASPQLAHRCIAEASRQEASHGSLHFT